MKTVHIDENGTLTGFPHHDGELDGILLAGKKTHMLIRPTSGESIVLSLVDVYALCVKGFRQGNIIDGMRLLSAECWVNEPEMLKDVKERLFLDPAQVDPKRSVFVLESSYGADIIAVCSSVEVREGELALAFSPGSEA